MRYRPELDGIRALAVLAVLGLHAGPRIFGGGWMGVDIFFVLSGYLITALLLEEHNRTGSVSMRRFYLRRVLRLYPALLLFLIIGLPFYKVLAGSLSVYGRSFLYSGLYVMDFVSGYFPHTRVSFGHTWSLAVEEQFYLLWPPLLVLLIRKRKNPLPWAIGGTLASWIVMSLSMGTLAYGNPVHAYFLPWSRFSQLLIGCALAIVVQRRAVPQIIGGRLFGWAAAAGCVGMVLLAAYFPQNPNFRWEEPAIAIATTSLVWHLASSTTGGVRSVLAIRPLMWLGRRSYGIYLIHLPVLDILVAHLRTESRSEIAAIMVALSIALAAVSYRFVELPFLRLKAHLRPPTEAAIPVEA